VDVVVTIVADADVMTAADVADVVVTIVAAEAVMTAVDVVVTIVAAETAVMIVVMIAAATDHRTTAAVSLLPSVSKTSSTPTSTANG
jgi:hypothetical protein